MATYLEIKQLLKDILCIEGDVDEDNDILIPISSYETENNTISLPNEILKESFNSLQNYSKEKLELTTSKYREVAIQCSVPSRVLYDMEPVIDTVNEITYSIGPASLAYCLFLLGEIVENTRLYGRRIYIDLRHKTRMVLRRSTQTETPDNPVELLSEILRVYTLKITSNRDTNINNFRSYAYSFEFLMMFRQHIPVSEYKDVQDIYSIGNSAFNGRIHRENMDSPPLRIYNSAVLDYYTMAMESRDPFTSYISFYHVVEHYFDAVFRKKLTQEMKEKMTHPGFSYNNEDKLYELAKYIKKHMNSDDESGKGNEFDSLKFVLMEYVPIEELKSRINSLEPSAISYYQGNFVPFSTSNKTKIAWSDVQGVYTNIATRIYETRNALVHSKSEQEANQYKPYEHKKDLILEMPLIRAVADLVLINSSEIL